MLKNNDKKLSFYIVPFIISFIFIVFVHSLNINSSINFPAKSQKENAIFFDKSSPSENYISMRILRSRVFEVFMGRDSLPDFTKKHEEFVILRKITKTFEKIREDNRIFCSILKRYKERILLI